MQSKSDRFPNGMGNDSGELGHNIMDHHFRCSELAKVEGFEDKYYFWKKTNWDSTYSRFKHCGKTNKKEFLRGYIFRVGSSRVSNEVAEQALLEKHLKKKSSSSGKDHQY